MILKTLNQKGRQIKDSNDEEKNRSFSLVDQKGICQYQNYVTFQKTCNSHASPSQIKVNNKLCKQNGEYMQKITVIKFNNQVITLKDRYHFVVKTQAQPPQLTQQVNPNKRIHLFKKPLHCQNKNDGKRRITKNLPKNFIKAFLNYLQSVKDQQNSELLDCKMKLFSSKQKYNNSFIQTIVDDSGLEQYFSDFLNHHAKQWIQKSKIRDKQVHLQAIQVFKKLYSSRKQKKSQSFANLDLNLSSFQQECLQSSSPSKDQKQRDKQSVIANLSDSEEQQYKNINPMSAQLL